MNTIDHLFTTKIYRSKLRERGIKTLNEDLLKAITILLDDDRAGQRWSEENGYKGYTSYASLDDLAWRMPEFKALQLYLDKHITKFVEDLDYDLGDKSLCLDNLWVNVLEPGGAHAAHIHPHSIISGTYYVCVPKGSSAIRFEDPRLIMMMAAPVRHANARTENQTFVSFQPKAGMVLLWESWLRHDVPMNKSAEKRVSISFNYRLKEQHDCDD